MRGKISSSLESMINKLDSYLSSLLLIQLYFNTGNLGHCDGMGSSSNENENNK